MTDLGAIFEPGLYTSFHSSCAWVAALVYKINFFSFLPQVKDNLEYLESFKALQTPAPLSVLKENRDDEKIENYRQGVDFNRLLLRIKNEEDEVKKLMDVLHSKMPW